MTISKKVPQMIATKTGLSGHIAISGCRSLSQSFGATFLELMVIENLTVALVNDHIIIWFLLKHVGFFVIGAT